MALNPIFLPDFAISYTGCPENSINVYGIYVYGKCIWLEQILQK